VFLLLWRLGGLQPTISDLSSARVSVEQCSEIDCKWKLALNRGIVCVMEV
jgi:hypothetical protein